MRALSPQPRLRAAPRGGRDRRRCRDRPTAPRTSARTAAGAPSTSLEPKFITTSRSTSFITKSMSCSTIRIVTPSPRSLRSSSPSACFSLRRRPAAGSSSTSSTGSAASARAISRMRCVPSGRLPASSCAALGQADARRAGAAPRRGSAPPRGGPAAARRRAARRGVRRVRAERDVVEQAHLRPQLHVLEGARHARAGRCCCCDRPVTSWPRNSTRAGGHRQRCR